MDAVISGQTHGAKRQSRAASFDRKKRDARRCGSRYMSRMAKAPGSITIDGERAWQAVLRRDRAYDGRFVTGVLSTGIYCRPSCAARHPARANVRFFADGAAARAAGLRPCKRCLPDDVARDEAAVAGAIDLLSQTEPPRLAALARSVGYAPHHFSRIFKRATGLTPAAWARAQRIERARMALGDGAPIAEALYDAGYAVPSRFYDETRKYLGMTPSAWRSGGSGETIWWAQVDSALGPMLVAGTARGICRLSFDEDEDDLRRLFHRADLVPAGPDARALVQQAMDAVAMPAQMDNLPLDVRGTAFQHAVWQALRAIPPGETRSYAQIAAAIGKPNAVRAVGTACGDNHVAVLIPCHRVVRSDGSLGGYAYGLERKRALLAAEGAASHEAVGVDVDTDAG